MRNRKLPGLAMLGAFVAAMAIGCGEGTDVKGVQVEEKTPPPPEAGQPLSKDMKQGGGPGSSGNMKRNPGSDPLKK
jgi:hypothetical protein